MGTDWMEFITDVMSHRPSGNAYLDSPRGMEVGKLCIATERELFAWRRSDPDTFWIDVQLFTKYKLSDDEIVFMLKMQPGIENYKKYKEERDAYAEMMRGMDKLKRLMRKRENMEK